MFEFWHHRSYIWKQNKSFARVFCKQFWSSSHFLLFDGLISIFAWYTPGNFVQNSTVTLSQKHCFFLSFFCSHSLVVGLAVSLLLLLSRRNEVSTMRWNSPFSLNGKHQKSLYSLNSLNCVTLTTHCDCIIGVIFGACSLKLLNLKSRERETDTEAERTKEKKMRWKL